MPDEIGKDAGGMQTPQPKAAKVRKLSILGEFFVFLKENKKWWLIPIITIFLLLGLLIAITSQIALAPLLYPFF